MPKPSKDVSISLTIQSGPDSFFLFNFAIADSITDFNIFGPSLFLCFFGCSIAEVFLLSLTSMFRLWILCNLLRSMFFAILGVLFCIHICFICDTLSFSFCIFFIEQFLFILPAVVPNVFVQSLTFCAEPWYCLLSPFSSYRECHLSFTIFSFVYFSLQWFRLLTLLTLLFMYPIFF